MKYIIVKIDGTKSLGCILFGQIISHKEMAQKYGLDRVVGAGFCHFNWSPKKGGWEATVYGESVTLEMKSKEEDAKSIEWYLNNTQ